MRNTACRDFSGLDTLTASHILHPLSDQALLELMYLETEKHPLQTYRAVSNKQEKNGHA